MQVIKYPHPTLRHKSKPLRRVDAEMKKIIRAMFDLMYEQKGIGLAANQVDLPYRFFIMNLESDPDKAQEYVFINPIINRRRGTVEDEEGCLSFPEIYAPVKRAEKIIVSAYDLTGEPIKVELSGLFARAVQHEYDHLDGVLFIDRLSDTVLAEIKVKLEKLESEFQGDRHRGIIPDDDKIATRLSELEVLRT